MYFGTGSVDSITFSVLCFCCSILFNLCWKMEGKPNTSNNSVEEAETPLDAIRVLVVDDDIICLSIVAGMLKSWKYQVVTVKNAQDALDAIRTRKNFFHLVVTDVHMPDMDGFKFQKHVREEFKLPVVMMSADDSERSMLRGLEAGAVFYIVKPVCYDDLKDLWQYALLPRKGASVIIKEIERAQKAPLLYERTTVPYFGSGSESGLVHDQEKQNYEINSSKMVDEKVKEGSDQEKSEAAAPRKTKVVWTTELHNEFLDAIRKIGLERAVPRRILEHMSDSGLTRENVASHLQKYRIFLKRIAEMSNCDVNSMEKNIIQKTLRSSFANGHPSLVIDAIKQGLLKNMQTNPSVGAAILSGQQASSSRPVPEHGSTNAALYQANARGIYGANPKQMYVQETKERLELVPDAASKRNFTACEVPCPSDIGDIQNMRHSNNYGLTPNFNSNHSIPDQMGLSGGQVLDGSIHGNSGNMDSTYYYPETYSSAGFGRTNQLLQRFSNVNQQDNNPILLSQQRYPGNGGDSSYLFDDLRTNDTSPGDGKYFSQLAGSDLHEKNFLNQQNNPSTNQQQAGKEVWNHGHTINSYPAEQNPLQINQQYSNLRRPNGIWSYSSRSSIHQLDGHFPSFDPYPNQQQAVRFQDPGPGSGYPNVEPSWNQGDTGTDIDCMFGPGRC